MPKRPSASRSLRTLFRHRALPAYLRTLSPEVLAQICSRVGLSDAAELMALAPVRQLVKALDASVWKTPRPGVSEVFDPRELLEWLAVWLDIGDEFMAERLEAIPDADLTLYFSHLLRVTTADMWGFERSTEIGDLDRIYAPSYHESAYGHYVATAAEPGQWETVRAALDALWQHAPERLLRIFSLLTGDESMLAPQANRESDNRDFASQRESTRERRGHVTAAGAQAFLAIANRPLEDLLTLTEYDLETSRHLAMLRSSDEDLGGIAPSRTEDADEDLGGIAPSRTEDAKEDLGGVAPAEDRAEAADDDLGGMARTEDRAEVADDDLATGPLADSPAGPARTASADEAELTALRTQMEAAGLIEPQRATLLLTHTPARARTPLVKRLERLAGDDPLAFETRGRELAYLASVLIAAVALEGQTLTAEAARDAALATCNLGLELLEQQGCDSRIDREPGLVRPFLVGWQTLGGIPARVLEALTRSLARLQAHAVAAGQLWMLDEATSSLAEVRAALSRRDFAAARESALLLTFVLDPHACRALIPLLDELPHLGGQAFRAGPQSRQGIAGQAERPQSRRQGIAGQAERPQSRRQGIAGQAERPQSRQQGIAGQAERPQWIQSLADLRGIGRAFRKLYKRRSPPRV